MSAKSGLEDNYTDDSNVPVVRFLQGAKLLGQTRLIVGDTIVEHAESA